MGVYLNDRNEILMKCSPPGRISFVNLRPKNYYRTASNYYKRADCYAR